MLWAPAQLQQLQLQRTRLSVRLQAAEEEETRAHAAAKRAAQRGSGLRKQHAALRCVGKHALIEALK